MANFIKIMSAIHTLETFKNMWHCDTAFTDVSALLPLALATD